MRETDTGCASDIRNTVVETLEHVLRLKLAEARWERLAELIEIAIEAQTAGDLDGLKQAADQLELAGPVRVTRIGGDDPIPPPAEIRERANELIYSLQSAQAALAATHDENSR